MVPTRSRIAYITAGAAQMYCGSCLRDNALVRALSRLECDVQLIPTYTPIRTDEEDVSADKLFFGGINVFLQQQYSLFRRIPGFLDRILDNRWLVRKLSSRSIQIDAHQLGEMTVSMLRGEAGYQAKEVHRLARYLKREIRPDLINLTNLLICGCVPVLKRELGVPILVTLGGDDLFLESLEEPYKTRALAEIRKLARLIDGFITFSRYYAGFMSEYVGIPPHRVHIVPLGLNLDDFQHLPETVRGRPTVGYLARICPEKGLGLLVDAFLELKSRPGMEEVRLNAAGWLGEKDRPFLERQVAKMTEAGRGGEFHYAGTLDRKEKLRFLRGLDVFSVPALYREPKGLYLLEALACGVPAVQPEHGAFPELLQATGGGKLFRPGDPMQLADCLAEMLGNPARRSEMGARGRSSVIARFSASRMAEATLRFYSQHLAV